MKKVIILSGGLDSTILTYKLVNEFESKNVYALTFHYGQKHHIELEKAKLTCKKLNVNHQLIDISFLGEMVKNVCALIDGSSIKTPTIKESLGHPQPPSYVPNRNMILLSIATSFAEAIEADSVYTGIQCQDNYGYFDATSAFIERINDVNKLNRLHDIQIIAPFANIGKSEEIELGLKLKVPFEDTFSCYNPQENEVSCGVCLTCSDRIGNFIKARVKDPIPYAIEIPWNF
jgi:7-cyano-7-deazaguanine synthase